MRDKFDPEERKEPDPTSSLSEDVASIDYASFGRKLAEVITKAAKASRRRKLAIPLR